MSFNYILEGNQLVCNKFNKNEVCQDYHKCSPWTVCYINLKIHKYLSKITNNDTKWAIQNLNSNIRRHKIVAKYIIDQNK